MFIVADDLTGAADAATCFRTGRRRVRVTFPDRDPWDSGFGSEVVQVYDTESRAVGPDEARRRVDRALRPLAALRRPLRLFKKIDSTLRGQIGAEVEAALRATGRRLALIAPAFPANHRTVRAGRLRVHGIPLTQTGAARDPRAPVTSDRVADAVKASSALTVREIDLATVRRPRDLREALAGSPAGVPSAAACDAETDADLDAIADAVEEIDGILPCGSAGLSRALADRWTSEPRGRASRRARVCTRNAVLVVVGSANPLAHEQLDVLCGALGVPVVEMDAERLANAHTRSSEIDRGRAAIGGLPGGIHALTLSATRVPAATAEAGSRAALEADLAAVAAKWSDAQTAAPGLVCTGGDTVLAVCRALGARALWPEGEVAAGVPWSTVEHPSRSPILVSKAGGFGGPRALVEAVEFLVGGAERHEEAGT